LCQPRPNVIPRIASTVIYATPSAVESATFSVEFHPKTMEVVLNAPEILKIIKRRMDAVKELSCNADTSEITVTRADMTRMLADEYADLLKEIEGAK
jgi:hypothetical protein